jgi:hypothetical protein
MKAQFWMRGVAVLGTAAAAVLGFQSVASATGLSTV